jgi:hypothetical protein
LLSYRFINNLLICFGLKHNPYMDGVTIGKRATLYPSASPTEKNPASDEICVLPLTARCNQYVSLASRLNNTNPPTPGPTP